MKLQLWDTCGQERFRSITNTFYRGAQGILIVYDVSDRSSFEHIRMWLADVKKFCPFQSLPILVGNKSDLKERVVSYQEGAEVAQQNGILFFETSAKNNVNIDEMFTVLSKTMIQKGIPSLRSKSTQPKKVSNQNKCCTI